MAVEQRQRGGWFSRAKPAKPKLRALRASAKLVDIEDRVEARRMRALRQGWQGDAWGHRDAIGELRYAIQFLANCAGRMKLYPAAYPIGGESDNPVPLEDVDELPDGVEAAATMALRQLGNGRLALSQIMESLSTNRSVAGECWLLGRQDPDTGQDTWTVRSVDEIVVESESYKLREIPSDPAGVIPWIELEPSETVLARIWTPHPRFRLLADAPTRAMLGECESLEILRRMIRATARSRLQRGLLLMPMEAEIARPIDGNEDPEAADFLGELTESMMEPIADEGVASAYVPLIIQAPAESLKEIRHLDLASAYDKLEAEARQELVGVIATTFDLPKEIIVGIADLNHWSAWQVDDNTFRHHVEPHVIGCCDSLTAAYLRPYMRQAGIDPEWVDRLVVWYDPTELVTHPDQTKDALELYDRHAISAEALARIAGFSEEDHPRPEETVVRMLQNMRTPPANLVMAAVHQMFPTLVIPPIEQSGTVPGVGPGGVEVVEAEPEQPALPPGPPPAVDGAPPPPVAGNPEQPDHAPPPSAVTAAGGRNEAVRLSRKLAALDQDLRARLQATANAAMLSRLGRVGNRLRAKAAKDETLKAKIAHRADERVAATIGAEKVATLGVGEEHILDADWSGLRDQFDSWVAAAQKQALRHAARIAGVASRDLAAAQEKMDRNRADAWGLFSEALTRLAHHYLYNPDPNHDAGEWAEQNPDTLVPAGTVRAVLAVAGGTNATITAAGDPSGLVLSETGAVSVAGPDEPLGQIGTGDVVSEVIEEAGGEQANYEWNHGPSLHPFEPHEELDGITFSSFDDPVLANPGPFPENEYFMPGDHDGCSCDFTPLWVSPAELQAATEPTGSAELASLSNELSAPREFQSLDQGVSFAVDTEKLSVETADAAQEAANAIGEVLSLGERVPVVQLPADDSATARLLQREGNPAIGVQDGRRPDLLVGDMTHEMGHYVDRYVLGDGSGFSNYGDALYQEMKNSPLMVALKDGEIPGLGPFADDPTTRLLYQGQEMFARAFNQFVAERSDDAALKAEIAKYQAETGPLRSYAWQPDEFRPIAAEMERLFAERGILRDASRTEWDTLLKLGEETKPGFDELLLKVGDQLGAEHLTRFDLEVGRLESEPDKAFVVTAPLKSFKRADEKVQGKYEGDWRRLGDVVRGTITVPDETQLVDALRAVSEQADAMGWRIVDITNRYTREAGDLTVNRGPTEAGYRDLSFSLVAPNGMVTELQLNTNAMMVAKEISGGHRLYESIRALLESGPRHTFSSKDRELVKRVTEEAQQLYARARASGARFSR